MSEGQVIGRSDVKRGLPFAGPIGGTNWNLNNSSQGSVSGLHLDTHTPVDS